MKREALDELRVLQGGRCSLNSGISQELFSEADGRLAISQVAKILVSTPFIRFRLHPYFVTNTPWGLGEVEAVGRLASQDQGRHGLISVMQGFRPERPHRMCLSETIMGEFK